MLQPLPEQWKLGDDGGRREPPKPPKGMRWVPHHFAPGTWVLDAELPVTPVERVKRWSGWYWIWFAGGIALWSLFLVLLGVQ